MDSTGAIGTTDETRAAPRPSSSSFKKRTKAYPLCAGEEAEALGFLSMRPIHNIILRGFIRDNGLVSPLNRGSFHGYRNKRGQLEGVALIGHATLIEARTEAALAALAQAAQQQCRQPHLLMGEPELVQGYWRYYAQAGQPSRLACRELLLEKDWPVAALSPVEGLRLATLADLDKIVPVQARMARKESGVNPLEVDPVGFRIRCARRVEQGRVWVCFAGGRLIFKADLMSVTPEAIYVEGIYIDPGERGKEYGLRCLSQMDSTLLARTKSVCLFVNEEDQEARAFYEESGYEFRAIYDTIFFRKNA
jgi:predicted GNAT family acetyltransferase